MFLSDTILRFQRAVDIFLQGFNAAFCVTLPHFLRGAGRCSANQGSSCISFLFAHAKRSAHRCRLMQFVSVRSKWPSKARTCTGSQSRFNLATAPRATPHPAAFVSRLFGIHSSTLQVDAFHLLRSSPLIPNFSNLPQTQC